MHQSRAAIAVNIEGHRADRVSTQSAIGRAIIDDNVVIARQCTGIGQRTGAIACALQVIDCPYAGAAVGDIGERAVDGADIGDGADSTAGVIDNAAPYTGCNASKIGNAGQHAIVGHGPLRAGGNGAVISNRRRCGRR